MCDMNENVRKATEQEQMLYSAKAVNMRPISIFEFTKPFTIQFWRAKAYYGYYHSRSFKFSWMRKIWKQNKVKPFWGYRDNGGKKSNGDKCLDATIGLGYLQLNYVNYNLQNTQHEN